MADPPTTARCEWCGKVMDDVDPASDPVYWPDICAKCANAPSTLGQLDALAADLAAAHTREEPAEWRFVYANGTSVTVSEREAHELAAHAAGHIEVRSAWRPLASAASGSSDGGTRT